jgi:glutamine synthetase
MAERVTVTREELALRIAEDEVDTVLVAFPDLQGRLVGKRVTGRFFVEEVAHHGTENCDYLIATDMDDNPVPGYRFASYDLGYGDMQARPDWSTVRILPWIPKTALVLCDLHHVDSGEPIEVAPRQVLRRQVERAASMGFTPMLGSELEFHLFRDSYEEAHDKGYRDLRPHSPWLEDYQIFQTTRDEYVIGAIRRGLEAAGVPVEVSKGEAGRGQHEINLRFSTAVEMADRNHVYKTAAKEIAALHGRAVSFMAKYDMDETGSSCHIHSSLWNADATVNVLHDDGAPHGMSETFRWWLGGQLASARELSLLWAPTINSYKRFQPGSWAPTGVGWGRDNRTLGYRVVGHGSGARVENRIPGADANSYLAFAATIAAGLHGIANRLDPGDAFDGNGYEATELPRIPWNIVEAIELWEGSAVARDAFGDDVHHHIANMARQEWAAFNRAVTDWELRRYWERA